VYQYLPDLIDAGVNIINPVQVGAKDMEPKKLKSEFGKYLTFWGGSIDTQHVLPHKSKPIIREHTKQNIKIFKQGGGFIFAPVHNIQPKVPPENTVELFKTALKHGAY
jgi:uroporphyrinogen decarboxylase